MNRVRGVKLKRLLAGEEGYVLIMSLFVLVILSMIGLGLAVVSVNEFNLSARTKLMDEAYAVAEAGINRGTVELKIDPTLVTDTPDGTHEYGQTGDTPQRTITENFGGGSYTTQIWQSEVETANPNYKVIVSTGTITKGGRNAERAIETRIVAGAGGEDYDASFDYLFYNGCKDDNHHGTWSFTEARFGSSVIAGNFTLDGATAYKGHSPKGAVYTRGSINLSAGLFGDFWIKGDVVATDDIVIQNRWAAHLGDSGFNQSTGDIIAGLDGSGSATIQTYAVGGFADAIQISGKVCASDNVVIDSDYNFGFFRPIIVGGIRAGVDVIVDGNVNISQSMQIGLSSGIVSGRKTSIESHWLSGITTGSIFAGQHPTDGIGVNLDTDSASSISAGTVTSRGKVRAVADLAGVTLSTVVAGNDTSNDNGGTGLYFDMDWASGCSAGQITSTGLVDLRANLISTINTGGIWAGTDSATGSGGTGVIWRGSVLSTIRAGMHSGQGNRSVTSRGDITAQMASGSNIGTSSGLWCGRNINMFSGEWLAFDDTISIGGSISAEGYVDMYTGDDIRVSGSVTTESWFRAVSSGTTFFSGNNGIQLGGAISAGSVNVPYAAGYNQDNPTNPGEVCSVYVNNNNDFPGFADNLNISGNVQAAGGIVIRGDDDIRAGHVYAGNGSTTSNVRIDLSRTWPVAGNNYTIRTNNIYASGNVLARTYEDDLLAGNWVTVDQVRAGGNAHLEARYGQLDVQGDVRANGNVYVRGYADSRVRGGLWGGGRIDVVHRQTLSGDFYIGQWGGMDSTNDGIRSPNRVYFDVETDWWPADEDCLLNNRDVRTNGRDISGNVGNVGGWYGPYASGPGYTNPGIAVPSVATPSIPSKPAAPTVGHSSPQRDVDVLAEAGLDAQVNILEPNWQYFETAAAEDDAANGPTTKKCPNCFRSNDASNPNCVYCGYSLAAVSPGPPHKIYDGGPGDYDYEDGTPGVNEHVGEIYLRWDASKPYSTKETIYNGDPDVSIVIEKLNWSTAGNYFEGTIVSRGYVYIASNNTDWFVGNTQVLNVVSGQDIVSRTSGLTLVDVAGAEYHFWADHDIRLDNLRIAAVGVAEWFGSFTAGNKVTYNSNSIWEYSTFRWSRWALDPVAWAPPFQVLNWREI